MSDENEQASQHIALPVEWHVSEQISSRYADNVVIQTKKHDATISFFEVQIPPFVGNVEETRTFLEKRGPLQAECVGKMIVAVDFLPELIQALQKAYDEYLAAREEERS